MISDIHSHTNFSPDGDNDPETLVCEMIRQGIEVFGICDHNYGIADRREEYLSSIGALKEKYKGKIDILCGIEMSTVSGFEFSAPPSSRFDYCLVEHLDIPYSVMNGDIVSYVKDYGCPVGIAHTDIFLFAEQRGMDVQKYLKSLADAGIFWELNVNYDSIHGYRELDYVKRFYQDTRQQDAVREAGLYISVGFDGHRLKDYGADRVKAANEFIENGGFNNAITLIRSKQNEK